MMEQTSPRTSSKWRPRETYASTVAITEGSKLDAEQVKLDAEHVVDVEKNGSML